MVVFDPYPSLPLSEFRDELLFEFKDLPTELFDYYILRVAREMAQKAPILRRKLRVDMEPCVTRYAIESPDSLEIQSIMECRLVSDGNIEHGWQPVRRFMVPPARVGVISTGCWLDDEGYFVIHIPGCSPCAYCEVVFSVVPARDGCELPKIYRDEFLTALMTGVRAQIMMISGKPWSNLKIGSDLYQEYQTLLSDQALRVQLHGQQGIVRMRHGRVL